MDGCIEAGLHADGMLPGILQVKRRAGAIREQLDAGVGQAALPGDWLGTYALAVNEENASGGRVVTAPTNGAAGILPAVLKYWVEFVHEGGDPLPGTRAFLLTATALGSLFKANASISGAEGGCQAEVGSACAMAAGGLTAVMHGTPQQVENAAEIAMEHHLGLTCDPVGGLVQIPCIERNAIAASTAVTAARLAMRGDGSHYVSLDTVVETMRQTGIDMSTKYKETSEGGLAVNVVEC
jgi:L-serine dehydratase